MPTAFRGSELWDLRYKGAPFLATPPFAYTRGRLTGKCFVDSQAYVMYRMVDGGGPDEDLKLYRCQNWFDADCNAFAYVYRGYIYCLGCHSHTTML